jgi:hypothetical protein
VTHEDNGDAEQPSALPAALAYGAGALAGARLGPGGAIVGAFSGPYLEIMLRRSFAEFGADARERVRRMMGSAREAARCTDAELEKQLLQSERTRLLNVTAIEAAAGTAWPPKVVALGRVLAGGVKAEEEAVINLHDLALNAMADMERPHVVLLDLLVRYEPEVVWQVGWKAVEHRLPSYLSKYVVGGEPFFWSPGHRIWTADQICDAQPQLGPALMGLLGTLERHGLARLRDSAPAVAKQFTEALGQLRTPTTTEIDPRWSPTELGEQVRAFYDEAATEDRAA